MVWAIGRMQHSTGTKFCETFIRFLWIVRTCIVNMYQDFFRVRLRLCACTFSCKSNTITLQNNVLLYGFILGISSKLWSPLTDQIIEIRHFSVSTFVWFLLEPHLWTGLRPIDEDNRNKPWFVTGYNMGRVILLIFFEKCQNVLGKWHPFVLLSIVEKCDTYRKLNFSNEEHYGKCTSKYSLWVWSGYKGACTK
jgi:hypothetical protein